MASSYLHYYIPSDPRYTPDGFQTAQFSPDSNSPRVMLEGAERTAQVYGVTREELDRWPVRDRKRQRPRGRWWLPILPAFLAVPGTKASVLVRP